MIWIVKTNVFGHAQYFSDCQYTSANIYTKLKQKKSFPAFFTGSSLFSGKLNSCQIYAAVSGRREWHLWSQIETSAFSGPLLVWLTFSSRFLFFLPLTILTFQSSPDNPLFIWACVYLIIPDLDCCRFVVLLPISRMDTNLLEQYL